MNTPTQTEIEVEVVPPKAKPSLVPNRHDRRRQATLQKKRIKTLQKQKKS